MPRLRNLGAIVMNRNMNSSDDFGAYDHIGEQPRKSSTRKSKKTQIFKKFEVELDDIDKNRHGYNRASSKNVARELLRNSSLTFLC